MKKIILTALLFAAFSTSALAANKEITGAASVTVGSMNFSVSNNVTVAGVSNATAYVFQGKHSGGSRVFATDSLASKIYWNDSNAIVAATATGVVASNVPSLVDGTGGWKAL